MDGWMECVDGGAYCILFCDDGFLMNFMMSLFCSSLTTLRLVVVFAGSY
jgi:hypothetical protein